MRHPEAEDDWFSSYATCFGFRRHALNPRADCWCITAGVGEFTVNILAVVDDFGTLVPVGVVQ